MAKKRKTAAVSKNQAPKQKKGAGKKAAFQKVVSKKPKRPAKKVAMARKGAPSHGIDFEKLLDHKTSQEQYRGLDSKLVSWLSPKRDIDLKLSEIMQELPGHYVLLLLLNLRNYSKIATELIRLLQSQKIPGTYFTINKTAEDLVNALIDEEIELSGISFIDAITLVAGRTEATMRNTVYLESPTDLVEMDTAIDEQFSEKEAEKKFLVFDSISTLLIYNRSEAVEKFCHSIMGKMHGKRTKSIFMMVNSAKDRPTIESISQFCDKVVELD